MFAMFSSWFKKVTTSSGKSILDEVEGLVTTLQKIQEDIAVINTTLEEIKAFTPDSIDAKITAVELVLSGLNAEMALVKKLVPSA